MPGPPVFVNVRDRLHALRALVDWLQRAGCERIVLLDNDSTWPPLLDWLDQSEHRVVRLPGNYGSRALWHAELVPADECFIYTDPDIVPIDACPLDAIDVLHGLLERHPDLPKVGLGLHLGDVPDTMASLAWERGPEINGPLIEPGARRSLIDTTFALCRPGAPFTLEAARTVWPYEARHLSPAWYGGELSDEDRHYLARAAHGPDGSSWAELRAAG